MISCCSSSGRSSKSSGRLLGDLLLPVAFGVGENLFALFLHALQAAAHGVDAGGEAPLQHGHREAERAATGGIICGGFDGLVFDVARQRVVEVPFVVVDLELGGLNISLGEQGLDLAGLGVREGDQRFLDAAQVERRLVLLIASSRLFTSP